MPAPKSSKRDPHAEVAQRVHARGRRRDQHALGDLEHQPLRLEPRRRPARRAPSPRPSAADVHVHRRRRRPRPRPRHACSSTSRSIAASSSGSASRTNDAGAEQAVARVLPARERLGGDDLAGLQARRSAGSARSARRPPAPRRSRRAAAARASPAGCISGDHTRTWPLPASLARYIATSAWRISSSAPSEPARAVAMPTRALHPQRSPSAITGSASSRACGWRPPRRGGRRRPPAARRTRRRPAAPRGRPGAPRRGSGRRAATSTASPAAWPRSSLIALKSSRSRNSTVVSPAPRAATPRAGAGTARRLREPGQRVRNACSSLCSSRMRTACSSRSNSSDMPAWLASVSNSRRSSVGERRGGADAVAEDHHAGQPRLPGTGATSACSIPRSRQVAARAAGAQFSWSTSTACSTATRRAAPRRARCRRRLHDLLGPSIDERRAQRRRRPRSSTISAVRTRNARTRAAQEVEQLGLEITPARERARDAVEELEALVLGALGHVGAVGEQQDHRRRDQQPAGAQVMRDDGGARQRDARVDKRHDQVGAHHSAPAAATGSRPRPARSRRTRAPRR